MTRIQMELALKIGGDNWWEENTLDLFIGQHLFDWEDRKTLRINPDGKIYLAKKYFEANDKDSISLEEAEKQYKMHVKMQENLLNFK